MAAAPPVKRNWSSALKHSDPERWVAIYPAYINSKKTRQDGRRIPLEQCVENPTYSEIRDVLTTTKLQVGVENKQYPRERSKELLYRGRIRVQLKNDDGTPVNPEFPTRESLLVYIGEKIPQLKSRQNKPAEPAASGQPQVASSSGGGGGNKKKNKRR
ncbi:SRP19 family protein [Megaselia abdita]